MSSSGPHTRKMKVMEEVLEVKEVDATQIIFSDIDKLQKELDALKEAELTEISQAKKIINDKFNGLRKPYYEKRAAVVERVPNFWGNAIAHHPKISKLVDERENECLHFLKKLEVEEFESGFRIKFVFDENPFFDNGELIKELQVGSNVVPKSSCTVIKWKENMNLAKKHDDLKLGKPKKTFFSWFANTQDPTTDDIAEAFKVDLWPYPLQYYKTRDGDASLLKKGENRMRANAALDEENGAVEHSWGTVPSVVLREVVAYLARNLDWRSGHQNKKSLLNLRLANTHWRNEMDSSLEFERLKTWTRLELKKDFHDRNPTSLATIKCVPILVDGVEFETNKVFCPTEVVELSGDGRNPFPAKSLTVTAELVSRDGDYCSSLMVVLDNMRVGLMVMELDKLFLRFGNHLTSLFLIGLVVTKETLQGILKNTPHLKALSLSDVTIDNNYYPDSDSSSDADSTPKFSPFVHPALRHIRLIHSQDDPEDTENVRLRDWILVQYQQQLETLKIDDVGTGMALGEAETDFAQLKRLTVWSVKTLNFLLEHEKFPMLTSLTLTNDERMPDSWKYLLEDLRFHLAPFAGKLVELHLGLHFRSHITSTRENRRASGKVFQFDGKQYLNEFRWSTAGVVFTKLKTLSIRTSMVVEEEESVRDMLRCVPNLEIFTLILMTSGFRLREEAREGGRQAFRTVVGWQWNQCPKMRKIILWESSEKVILTEHFKEH